MKKLLSYILFLSLMSCSGNIFQDATSNSGEDDYILQARQYLNEQKYDESLQIIQTKLSQTAQDSTAVREIIASNYGGKCGLNFVQFTLNLSSQTTGSAFYRLMTPFVQVAVDPSHCKTSLSTMELIGTTSQRTANQNAFVAVMGMVLMGTAMRGYADINPALGNGIADVNICSGLTDTQVDDIIIGFGYMSKNLTAVGSSLIGPSSLGSMDQLITTCTTIAGSNCEVTDPAAISPTVRSTVRDLLNTQEYGIGSFSTGGNDLLIPGACP